MAFKRSFSSKGIEEIKAKGLYKECLLPDIKAGTVFPAVRNGRMDFYYMGGKLFSFTSPHRTPGRFTTHNKYASVIESDSPYVTEEDLRAIPNFTKGYARIKKNCSLYSGIEARGVSQIYSKYSCAVSDCPSSVVVLDIEISLRKGGDTEEVEPGISKRAGTDQIDLLLFDTQKGVLRFFEAKDFSNREIRAKNFKPQVLTQMKRYSDQIVNEQVRKEIISAYRKHIDVINTLFRPKSPLPYPQYVDQKLRLLVFGFDSLQSKKLQGEVKAIEAVFPDSVYAIGDIKGVKAENLFSGGKKHWPQSK